MRSEQDNLEQLRRLLALKRHEQPPPGYFERFPVEVMTRIKAGEHRILEDPLETYFVESPWLQRIWAALEGKPALAGVFGALVCGLLVSGVVYSEHLSSQPVSLPSLPGTELTEAPSSSGSVLTPGRIEFSTNGVQTAPSSLFDEIHNPGAKRPVLQQVVFPAPSGN